MSDDQKEKLFDKEKAKVRHEQLRRMLAAHDFPDDGESAVVLFTEGVNRLVEKYGPHAMSAFASLFVDTWRQAESRVIKGVIIETLVDQYLKQQPDEEMKH